jgi:DNA-binding MarR family transcriptional regulator
MAEREMLDSSAATPALEHSAAEWPLGDRPGFLLRRMHQIHVSLFAERCAEARITPLQFSLLSALADCIMADQSTLASMIALDRTTTTGALKRLEARGLVRRASSPKDRRSQVCRLTADGEQLLRTMEVAARRAHEDTVAPLTPAERQQFIEFMKRIVNAYDERL